MIGGNSGTPSELPSPQATSSLSSPVSLSRLDQVTRPAYDARGLGQSSRGIPRVIESMGEGIDAAVFLSRETDPIDDFFPAHERATARCIRWHESRGELRAVSPTDDWGAWQIHRGPVYDENGELLWEGWEDYFLREWGEWKPFDPIWSTRAARHIYDRAGGWSPWTTYAIHCS